MKKIITTIKAYFKLLNMDPGAERFLRKRPPKEISSKNRLWLHILLFAATFFTTSLAGSQSGDTFIEIFISGLPFSVSIMFILLSHEMGHYFAARHFGVAATLPYFIPFPSIIGTMGAVIKMKSPIKDRRSLLYIGAMGPLAGFIPSLIAAVAGIYLSEVKALPAETDGLMPIFGDSILFSFIVNYIHGEIPFGHDIYLSPYAWAGWIGFLVTSLNLMPIGQLDGAHILYALYGRKQIFFGWTALSGLVILSFFWPGWILWIIIVLLFIMVGHPHIEGGRVPSAKEKIIGWCCIAIFFATFIPVPVKFI